MESIVALGSFVVLVIAVHRIGRWILGPIDRAAKNRQAPYRISIGDLLCLFIAVQLPLTVVSRLRTNEETRVYFWLFTFLAWVVAPIVWIACALALSRAGVANGKHRLIFMGLVLPFVYYGLTPFVVLAVAGCIRIFLGGGLALIRDWWWLILGWVLLGFALIGCGRYTHWLIRQVEQESLRLTEAETMSERLDDTARRQ